MTHDPAHDHHCAYCPDLAHDSDPADLIWLGLVLIIGAAVAVGVAAGLLVWWVLP